MLHKDPFSSCRLCPRDCRVNRRAGERGVCGETAELRLATASLHFGEEPPLIGEGGSGTIFVTGCSMKCPFCQNHQISRCGAGRVVGKEEFVSICLTLEDAGAENINLVTPSHAAPVLADYLGSAKDSGLGLPVAWNSSGFESLPAVEIAAPMVDIWLPDLKILDSAAAERRYGVPGYPAAAEAAVLFMADLRPLAVDDEGVIKRGLMVRHLVLPGEMESTREVLRWFGEHLAGRAWLSVMTQYTPVRIPGEKGNIPERQLNQREYDTVLEWLDEFSIDDGFVQDLLPGNDWLPDFNRGNPFGSSLSKMIWRWDGGFVLSADPSANPER
ncbi:MAG: 4Fe-4S cluster-binding domain-containing protein [Spirochaetaceae bacterium]|nr:4Fe-4S cluster-binding domain-containing protein [Spirochaetaceae bacterium]MDT8298434.1 4Fe-4S cluster-binding domain-containing protein [Spirochaetaceae bacterium]